MEALETKQPLGSRRDRGCSGARRCLSQSNPHFLCPTWRKSHVYPLNNWNLTIPRSIRGEFLLLGTTHRFLLPALFKRMETGSFHSETLRKLRWGSHRHPKHLIQHISNRAAGTARLAGLGKWLSPCTQHCEPTPWVLCSAGAPRYRRHWINCSSTYREDPKSHLQPKWSSESWQHCIDSLYE